MIVLFQIISILLPQRLVVGLTPAFRIFQFWFEDFGFGKSPPPWTFQGLGVSRDIF